MKKESKLLRGQSLLTIRNMFPLIDIMRADIMKIKIRSTIRRGYIATSAEMSAFKIFWTSVIERISLSASVPAA